MTRYGQFCPVAKAMETLDERWTMLIVRELLCGSSRFNELRRGLPRMSPALLTTRLRSLERAGLVRRSTTGNHVSYELTQSGLDLRDVVHSLGLWGLRWIGELGEEDLDPHLLFFDISRTISLDDWPRQLIQEPDRPSSTVAPASRSDPSICCASTTALGERRVRTCPAEASKGCAGGSLPSTEPSSW